MKWPRSECVQSMPCRPTAPVMKERESPFGHSLTTPKSRNSFLFPKFPYCFVCWIVSLTRSECAKLLFFVSRNPLYTAYSHLQCTTSSMYHNICFPPINSPNCKRPPPCPAAHRSTVCGHRCDWCPYITLCVSVSTKWCVDGVDVWWFMVANRIVVHGWYVDFYVSPSVVFVFSFFCMIRSVILFWIIFAELNSPIV